MKNFRFILYLFVAIGFSVARADVSVDMFRAVMRDDAPAVTKLLAAGADPNLREKGQTALYVALRAESYDAADVLAAHPKLDVDAVNEAGETALMMAALRGRIDLCKRLMDRGAALDREGWTPLHYAASGGGEKVTALLLAAGARIDARAPNGATPLMMAVRFDTEATVDLLLARGASLTARSNVGLTAADHAEQVGRAYLVKRLSPPPSKR